MNRLRTIIVTGVAGLALVSATLPGYAQEQKVVPRSKADMGFSFAPVVKRAAPAVVNIYTRSQVTVQENASPFMNDPFFRQFFGHNFAFPGRTKEQIVSSLGSGVIINSKGFIVTSHHVIRDAQQIKVILSNKEEFDAKVVVKDPQSDLAFLKIETDEPLPYIEMSNSDTLEVGDLVLAIGNPFGVGQTVTNGIISALARKAAGVSDYQFFIQTDAAINPGNSGGALVTMDGKLAGINTAIYSKTGGSQGIGFAIPANMIRSLLTSKVEGGRIIHPWLGIAVQPVTHEMADSIGLKSVQGVIVRKIYPDSPADKSGVKVGDVVLTLNDAGISSEQDLQYRLALSRIGMASKVKLVRGGAEQEMDIVLAAPPETPARDLRKLEGFNPFNGLTVANLSPALAVELGMDDDVARGVTVVEVGKVKQSITVGWRRGDILLEINGTRITDTAQLEKLVKTIDHGWKIVYARGGKIMSLTVRM